MSDTNYWKIWAKETVAEAAKYHNVESELSEVRKNTQAEADKVVAKMAASVNEELKPAFDRFMAKANIDDMVDEKGKIKVDVNSLFEYEGKLAQWQADVEDEMKKDVPEETELDEDAMRAEARKRQAEVMQAFISQAKTEVQVKSSRTAKQLAHDAEVA